MSKSRAAKEISKLKRVINHHINSGGNVHLPATEATPGMMTEKQVKQLNHARSKRISMPKGTDVLTLEDGHYEIAGAKNNPIGEDDLSFIEYDIAVDPYEETRRQITATLSNNGYQYVRTIHTGGSPTSGTNGWNVRSWNTPIWRGNVNEGTINFSRSIPNNFIGVEVFYTTISGQNGSKRFKGEGTVIFDGNHPDTDDRILQTYEIAISITNNSLKIIHNNMIAATTNTIQRVATKGINIIGIDAL